MTSWKSENKPKSQVSLTKIVENIDSLLWEYISLAAMGLVQGISQKLPTETWKTHRHKHSTAGATAQKSTAGIGFAVLLAGCHLY